MENVEKRSERSLYFKYFRGWFIITAIILLIYGGIALFHKADVTPERANTKAPAQRVYDYANVLTDSEEQELSRLIDECERKGTCDIILVTTNIPMGISDYTWEKNMMNYADDFYDEGKFGYDKPYGDGALLLDNWYEDSEGSQKGSWLSTSGKMERIIGAYEEDDILDRIYLYIDSNPKKAYAEGIKRLAYWGNETSRSGVNVPVWVVFWVPLIISLIYMFSNMYQAPGEVTTTPMTYVPGGKPVPTNSKDLFLRKSVSKVKIESSSSSSGGRSHSGGGSHGHHTSSGGHSHGGGGRRR